MFRVYQQKNNSIFLFVAQEGAFELSQAIKSHKIEKLDLRLNPLTSQGVAPILSIVKEIPLKELNLACCSIDCSIDVLLLKLLKENKTLRKVNLSTNKLGNVSVLLEFIYLIRIYLFNRKEGI